MSRLHKPKAGFWIRLCVVILYPLDGLLFRIRWRHLERMPAPEQGGVIVAINHISHVDTVLMARLIWQSGRIPRFLVKAGLFDVAGHRRDHARRQADPGLSRHHRRRRSRCARPSTALEQGEAVIFYPEGTITKDPDQWPMQAKTGIARLVLLCPDIPVVPVGPVGRAGAPGRGVVAAGPAPSRRRVGRRAARPVPLPGVRAVRRDAARDHRRDHGRGPGPGRGVARRAGAGLVLPQPAPVRRPGATPPPEGRLTSPSIHLRYAWLTCVRPQCRISPSGRYAGLRGLPGRRWGSTTPRSPEDREVSDRVTRRGSGSTRNRCGANTPTRECLSWPQSITSTPPASTPGPPPRRWTSSTSTSRTASSWCSSDRPGRASPPPCACSPGWRRSRAARSASTATTSRTGPRRTATSRWCSRTTRCTRT